MSVRVNLLPQDVRAREQATRARFAALGAALLLVAVLAGLWLLQQGQISDANDRLAEVEARNAALEADIVALQPFADLQARVTAAETLIASALGVEASAAGVLQDLSLVYPPTAELDSLTMTFSEDPLTPQPGGDRLVYGQLTAIGRTVVGVSPGVERVLIDLGRAAVFENAYVTTTTVDEDGVTTFSLESEFGEEVRTGRYVFGDGTEVAP